jgi:DNA-3-methyladenine glycosylase II
MPEHAIEHLRKSDHRLRRIIDRVGPCALAPRRDYFPALCEAIVSQQLAAKAAATIFRRFTALFARHRPTGTALLELGNDDLRGAGLSRQKIGYLRDLATKFNDGTIPQRRLARMDDDAVIAALTQVKGVGVWTGQMFLIFVLNRPDILPVDDLGLRKAAQLLYNLPDLPARTELTDLAEPWRPFRSVATWYLWQSLNGTPPAK